MPASEPLLTLDLYDLTVLDHLLRDGSVTRVAERLGKTQPAVSRTLRRLRRVLADPLLVRSGASMVATERALAVRDKLAAALHDLRAMSTVEGRFDPLTAQRTFAIGAADCLEPTFLPRIIEIITAAGPSLRVDLHPIDPLCDVHAALERGALDLVINNCPRPAGDLRTATLYDDDVVCMMHRGHPAARHGRLTLDDYLALRHVAPTPSSARELGPIDGTLSRLGHRRAIAATVPEYNIVQHVLAMTDLVFTTGRSFAQHHARGMPLDVVSAPVELMAMRFYMLWHDRSHLGAANGWLRRHVAGVARALFHGAGDAPRHGVAVMAGISAPSLVSSRAGPARSRASAVGVEGR